MGKESCGVGNQVLCGMTARPPLPFTLHQRLVSLKQQLLRFSHVYHPLYNAQITSSPALECF